MSVKKITTHSRRSHGSTHTAPLEQILELASEAQRDITTSLYNDELSYSDAEQIWQDYTSTLSPFVAFAEELPQLRILLSKTHFMAIFLQIRWGQNARAQFCLTDILDQGEFLFFQQNLREVLKAILDAEEEALVTHLIDFLNTEDYQALLKSTITSARRYCQWRLLESLLAKVRINEDETCRTLRISLMSNQTDLTDIILWGINQPSVANVKILITTIQNQSFLSQNTSASNSLIKWLREKAYETTEDQSLTPA